MYHIWRILLQNSNNELYLLDSPVVMILLHVTGIWSQKMQLCLEDQWVLVMDYETGVCNEIFKYKQYHIR